MNFNDIEKAARDWLIAMGPTPIAWPNADFTPNGTYIEFRHSPNTRQDETGDAIGAYQLGIFLITVVTPAGGFSTAANDLAQELLDRFPKGLRLGASNGNVVFNAAASPGTPFQDGAYWRQPVTASYITEGTSPSYTLPAYDGDLIDMGGA